MTHINKVGNRLRIMSLGHVCIDYEAIVIVGRFVLILKRLALMVFKTFLCRDRVVTFFTLYRI